jgi:tRNA pseudouridine38-40 synthase
MRNIALLVAYDGTEFIGSQWQQLGRSVQGALEEAWEGLTQERRRINLAGRTDAGVHARGQVANVRTATGHDTKTIVRALNAHLPNDVTVFDAVEVAEDFHARHSAIRRGYRYFIDNQPVPLPMLRQTVLHVERPLNTVAMNDALAQLVGRHDFASFTSPSAEQRSTVRTCYHAACRQSTAFGWPLVAIELEANAFLYTMVRAIVGTVLLVGQGRMTVDEFGAVLARCDRRAAGKTAPAHGLTLETVGYPPEQLRWGVAVAQEK